MANLPKYHSSGTASVANGATAVTGTGSAWANQVRADDRFTAQGFSVRIASVTDNTHLTLAQPWPGTSLVGASYEIAITYDGPEFQLRVRELLESGILANGFDAVGDAADARLAYSSPNLGTQSLADTYYALTRGTSGAPDSRSEPIFALTKISNNTDLDRQNITAGFFIEKRSSADGAHATALFTEATDYAGWDGTGANNFIEGARLHAVLVSGGAKGSAYGAILFGGAAAGIDWTYLIGAEGDVANNYSDQPTAATFNKNKFAAAFVATARGSYKSDAGFVTNPYNTVAFRTGFLVAEDSVDGTAFVSRATTSIGLDLSLGTQTYSAIRFDNNIAMHAKNAAGSGDLNLLYASTSDFLVLGQSAAGLQLHTSDMTASTVRVVTMGAADSGGAGFRLLRVPNS